MSDTTYSWRRPQRSPSSGDRDASDFGFAMERLREQCGWARAEVADRSGSLAYSTVAGIENGHRPPSKRTLGPLARGLGVDYDDLEGFWQLVQSRAPDETLDSAWRAMLAEATEGTTQANPMTGSRTPTPGSFARHRAPIPGPRGARAMPTAKRSPAPPRPSSWEPSRPSGSNEGWLGNPFDSEFRDEIDLSDLDSYAGLITLDADDIPHAELAQEATIECQLMIQTEPLPESQREGLIRELQLLAGRLPEDELATAVQVLRGLVAKARDEGNLSDD